MECSIGWLQRRWCHCFAAPMGSRNFLHAQTCQNRSTSERDRRTGRRQMIEVEPYTLALSKWAVMGKANPVLLFGTNSSTHFAPITAAVEQCATALGDGLLQLDEE